MRVDAAGAAGIVAAGGEHSAPRGGAARRFERMLNAAPHRAAARALVHAHRIDGALVRRGTYRGAATARGAAALRDYQRFLDAAGLPYEARDADALQRWLGTR